MGIAHPAEVDRAKLYTVTNGLTTSCLGVTYFPSDSFRFCCWPVDHLVTMAGNVTAIVTVHEARTVLVTARFGTTRHDVG